MSVLSSFSEGPRRYIALGVGAVIVVLLGIFLFSKDDGLNDNPLRDVIRAGNKGNVKKLEEFTKDPDINKAVEALNQLARVQKKEARPLMERMLSDPRVEMRAGAAHAMSLVGDPNDCGALVGALSDAEPIVRMAACRTLGDLRAGASALPMLALVETDKQTNVREVALASSFKAMGATFPYRFNAAPAERQRVMVKMRKFASALGGKTDAKPVDITKSN